MTETGEAEAVRDADHVAEAENLILRVEVTIGVQNREPVGDHNQTPLKKNLKMAPSRRKGKRVRAKAPKTETLPQLMQTHPYAGTNARKRARKRKRAKKNSSERGVNPAAPALLQLPSQRKTKMKMHQKMKSNKTV